MSCMRLEIHQPEPVNVNQTDDGSFRERGGGGNWLNPCINWKLNYKHFCVLIILWFSARVRKAFYSSTQVFLSSANEATIGSKVLA